jgi:phage gp36-like protein
MYATLEDLTRQIPEDLLIQLTDDVGSGVIDTAVTDTALETADVEIDGYLGARYPLPLATVPPVIAKQAVDIAIYNLYARRMGPPEHWQKRYENVIRFLERVADGRISLGAGDPEPPAADEAMVSSAERIFTRTNLSSF